MPFERQQVMGFTNSNWRYGALLLRGGNNALAPSLLVLVIVNIKPDNPRIIAFGPAFGLPAPSANKFFAGKAEAVLAVTALDPSGNNNGSFAFVVAGESDRQALPPSDENHLPGIGRVVIVRNAFGDHLVADPNDADGWLHVDEIFGLTGPVSVAIDEGAPGGAEVIVVEKTEDGEGEVECPVGKSPLRFFRLADADEAGGEVRRMCIDGVGDSADIEVYRDPLGIQTPRAFIARSFSEGGVAVIRLDNYSEETALTLYPAGGTAPAPGLDLDLAAARGYLASPDLPTPGVLEFNLVNGQFVRDIGADVYYHVENGIPTGLQEVSVANHPNPINTVRRGIVISRGDPVNYPNRADQVTRINLITANTNRLYAKYHTTAVGFVPQRSTDQANQQFFLRIYVLSTDAVRLKLKPYDSGTAP